MNKFLAIALCSVSLNAVASPVFAADDTVSFGNVIDGVAFTTAKLVKFTTCSAVGVPFAMVRKSLHSTGKTAETVTGKTDNSVAVVAAEAALLPLGVFYGSLEGIGYGVQNSWDNAAHDKPFTKNNFSLGDAD